MQHNGCKKSKPIEVRRMGDTHTDECNKRRREDTDDNSLLPVDIEISILLRLPPKTLVRFRFVSKRWLTLITSQCFIKLYQQSNNRAHPQSTHGSDLLMVGNSTISVYDFSGAQVVGRLPSPPISLKDIRLLGSSNGLLCLEPNPWLNKDGITLALYNPITQDYRVLPTLKTQRAFKVHYSMGFGYDHNSDDFKVVCFLYFDLYIYRMRNNFWELINLGSFGSSRYSLAWVTQETPVVFNNALHWHGLRIIVAFDLGTEKFYEIPLPQKILCFEVDADTYCNEIHLPWELAEIRGCLHLVLATRILFGNERSFPSIEIWIMKEYGVEESWTKLLYYSSNEVQNLFAYRTSPPLEFPNMVRPHACAYSKDGQEILVGLGKWVMNFFSCDLQTRDVKKVEALCNLFHGKGVYNQAVSWTCTFASCY